MRKSQFEPDKFLAGQQAACRIVLTVLKVSDAKYSGTSDSEKPNSPQMLSVAGLLTIPHEFCAIL